MPARENRPGRRLYTLTALGEAAADEARRAQTAVLEAPTPAPGTRMNPLLACAIASGAGMDATLHAAAWTRRRATAAAREIDSDLWEFHEDARRRGRSPAGIAVHMMARLCLGVPHDLLWRFDIRRDAATTLSALSLADRRAPSAPTVCIAALWAFFAVTSLVALAAAARLDSTSSVSICKPMRPQPPPPPPPPPPRRIAQRPRASVWVRRLRRPR